MIIAVGSEKGGVGKSTLAIQMAGAFASKGQSVCLLDVDTGTGENDDKKGVRTSQVFCQDRMEGYGDSVSKISGFMGNPDVSSFAQLKDLSSNYDVVILDTPGAYCKAFTSACMLADKVILVSEESKLSYPILANLKNKILESESNFYIANNKHMEIDVLVVLSRVEYNKNPDLKRVHKFYAENLMDTFSFSSQAIKSTNDMKKTAEEGLTVYDHGSFNRSGVRGSIDLLVDEITGVRKPRFVRGQEPDEYLKKLLKDDKINA